MERPTLYRCPIFVGDPAPFAYARVRVTPRSNADPFDSRFQGGASRRPSSAEVNSSEFEGALPTRAPRSMPSSAGFGAFPTVSLSNVVWRIDARQRERRRIR